MRQTGIIVLVIAILAIVAGIIIWGVSGDVPTEDKPEITSFTVEQPDFVVRTKGISTVEIYGVPAASTSTDDILIGEAEEATSTEAEAVWTLPIPQEPMNISLIYAEGFNDEGDSVARSELPFDGPRAIYEALWLDDGSTTATLGVGDSTTVQGNTLTFSEVREDSRCPGGQQCPDEGVFRGAFELETDTGTTTNVVLSTGGEQQLVDNIVLDMLGVEPAMPASGTIADDEYQVEVLIFRQAKL